MIFINEFKLLGIDFFCKCALKKRVENLKSGIIVCFVSFVRCLLLCCLILLVIAIVTLFSILCCWSQINVHLELNITFVATALRLDYSNLVRVN
jgi:hypothetical protein